VSSELHIRPLDVERDAEAVVAILREANPQWILTAEGWRHTIQHWPKRAEPAGWVAVDGRDVVGLSHAHRHAWTTEPDVAFVRTTVRADHRGRGIGSRLYAVAEQHVFRLRARRLLCSFVETPEALRFAEARHFTPERVAVHSVLDPAKVDLSRLDALPPRVRVTPVADLKARLEDVYATVAEAVLDEPTTVPEDDFSFEQFLEELQNPLSSWEGTFCTLEDDEVATFAGIVIDAESRTARNGFTGTRRDFRGRGYATLAKLASVRWLVANGYTHLWTGNDETNATMLAVNRRLGYRPALRALEVCRHQPPTS
jgi:GNAT superfamily N-acetyltransferase